MFPTVKFSLLSLVVLLGLVDLGYSLECVYCNSTEFSVDEDCVKGTVMSKITCSYEFPCYAAKYELESGGRVSTLAFRGCMLPGKNCQILKDQTQRTTRSRITRDECSTCNTHLCNSAPYVSIPLATMLVSLLVCKFY